VLVWRGPEQSRVATPDEIAPGDTIVVPADYGGADAFGWHPALRVPVADLADSCALEAALLARGRRRVARLRLHPGLGVGIAGNGPGWPTELATAWQAVARALSELRSGKEVDLDTPVNALLDLLPETALPAGTTRDRFRQPGRTLQPYPGDYGLLVTVPLPLDWTLDLSLAGAELAPPETDEDDVPRATRQCPCRHLQGVAEHAARFAACCGLRPDLVHDLRLAGLGHDLGKVEPRTQLLLHGGDYRRAALAGEPVAKSGQRFTLRQLVALWEEIGYPRGFRHEFLSVALLQGNPAALAGCHDPDLVLYLIGVHHGRGRPLVPPVGDESPEAVQVDFCGHRLTARSDYRPGLAEPPLWRLDSGWVDRYWRLLRRYGPWGLAYLEAVLRLADGVQSSLEEEGANGPWAR
jgi:CRISPR-associated endonuclease/helicase Cas3